MAPSPTLLILCKGGCSFCASTKRRAGRTCLQARPFLREMQVLPARSASNLAPAHCNYEADATQWSHAPRTLPISILSPVRHRPAPKRRPRSINCRIFTKLGKPCDTISACFERCARNALIVRVLFRTKKVSRAENHSACLPVRRPRTRFNGIACAAYRSLARRANDFRCTTTTALNVGSCKKIHLFSQPRFRAEIDVPKFTIRAAQDIASPGCHQRARPERRTKTASPSAYTPPNAKGWDQNERLKMTKIRTTTIDAAPDPCQCYKDLILEALRAKGFVPSSHRSSQYPPYLSLDTLEHFICEQACNFDPVEG